MEIADSLSLLAIFVVYSLIEGWREAQYFHFKVLANNIADYKEHSFFAVQRFCFICALACYFEGINHMPVLTAILSQMLMFSFLHNGMYYTQRDRLRPGTYPNKWISQTTTSNATLNFNFPTRTIMFVAGLGIYCAFNVLKISIHGF